jgi:CRISPR-associated endonuclease Cas2
MKKNSKRIIKIVAVEMWEFAKAMGGLMGTIAFTPYGQLRITSVPRTTYYRKLRKFESYGLIKRQKESRGYSFVITQKAKVLRRKMEIKKLRTDGFFTLIIFDIPESKHNARDTLRRYLIRNGYTQIQRSSFLSKRLISEDLKELITELVLDKNLNIFAVKNEKLL